VKPTFRHKIRLTGHNASIFALAPGEGPSIFYSASGDGWIVRWDLQDPEMGRLVAEAPEQVFSLAYLPEQAVLVAGTMNGQVNWIHLNDPEKTKRIEFHRKGVYDIQLIEGALYTLGGGGVLTRWNVASQRPEESLQLSAQRLRSLSYSPQRKEMAVGASDGNIYLLGQETMTLWHTIEDAHEFSAFTVAYAPDGQALISGGRDARLCKWDLRDTPSLEKQLPAHRYTINDMAISPDGALLATASRDRSIRIWDVHTLELLKVMEAVRDAGHLNSVNRVLWTDHQGQLVSASDDRTLIVWDYQPGSTSTS
jgi:WD40 repeat protein